MAALDDLRQLLNLSRLDWDKEGKTFRPKKILLTTIRRAWYVVGVQRFHTQPQPGAGSAGPWVDYVQMSAAVGGTYGEYGYGARRRGGNGGGGGGDGGGGGGDGGDGGGGGGDGGDGGDGGGGSSEEDGPRGGGGFAGFEEDSYFEQHSKMIEASNKDGEACLLNQLSYDLLTGWQVDQMGRSFGLSEVRHLMRKFWPAWLQTCGTKGHFHIIHHFVRQLLSVFVRSERRSVAAFMGSPVSWLGTFGKDDDADAVQEAIVLMLKKYLPKAASGRNADSLHRQLRRVASSLHVPLHVIPQLQHLWGVGGARHVEARRYKGAQRRRVRELVRVFRRVHLVPDSGRVATPGELGELGCMLRSRQLEVRTTESCFDLLCFHYPSIDGGPPVLTQRAVLAQGLEDARWSDATGAFADLRDSRSANPALERKSAS